MLRPDLLREELRRLLQHSTAEGNIRLALQRMYDLRIEECVRVAKLHISWCHGAGEVFPLYVFPKGGVEKLCAELRRIGKEQEAHATELECAVLALENV